MAPTPLQAIKSETKSFGVKHPIGGAIYHSDDNTFTFICDFYKEWLKNSLKKNIQVQSAFTRKMWLK